MIEEEERELMKFLATSTDFLAALQEALDNVAGKEVPIHEIGFWFFTQGYMSCQNFIEREKMFRAFKYEVNNND